MNVEEDGDLRDYVGIHPATWLKGTRDRTSDSLIMTYHVSASPILNIRILSVAWIPSIEATLVTLLPSCFEEGIDTYTWSEPESLLDRLHALVGAASDGQNSGDNSDSKNTARLLGIINTVIFKIHRLYCPSFETRLSGNETKFRCIHLTLLIRLEPQSDGVQRHLAPQARKLGQAGCKALDSHWVGLPSM